MSANPDIEYVVRNEQLFGQALKEFRQRDGIRQADLAERLDLHRSYLSGIESGRSTTAMRALMRAFRELDLEVVVRKRRR